MLAIIATFLISYSLISNNPLNASLPIMASDNNKETKIYYHPEEDEETIIIDIANTINNSNDPIYRYYQETNEDNEIKISINTFKLFNTENKKIIINNSNKRTKSKLLKDKEIEPNINYDNDSIADTIIFLLEDEVDNESSNTNILFNSSFEVLGSVNNLIFLGSNNIIVKGLHYTDSISKLTLATGTRYNIDNDLIQVITNDRKISLLPSEDEDHISINASEVNELNIIAREIDISGEVIVKGSLVMKVGLNNSNNDNNEPKNLFHTSSFGNIKASSIKLINFEENSNINLVNTSITSLLDSIDINLKKGNTLSLYNAQIISKQSTLAITTDNLILDRSSVLSSQNNMTLILKSNLLNINRSIIHTAEYGDLIIETQNLKNKIASTIHSGGMLKVNCKFLENIGLDDQEKHPKNYGNPCCFDIKRYSVSSKKVVRGGRFGFYQKYSAAFIETYEGTGIETPLNSVSIICRSMLDIKLTTSQSKITALGNITINGEVVHNFGSQILSLNSLFMNLTSLINERTGFQFTVRFIRERYWRTKKFYHWEYRSRWMDRHTYTENKYFYSNTPSVIYGKNMNLNIRNIVNDPATQEAFHIKASTTKIPSFICADNNLTIAADSIKNGGIISSLTNKNNISSPVISNIDSSHASPDLEEFKSTLSSIRENVLIHEIIINEKFRNKISNASNLKNYLKNQQRQ